MRRVLAFLMCGPVLTALLFTYLFKINMPVWQALLLGLIPSVSGLWADWRQFKAGSDLAQRAWASVISGAFGGVVMAAVPNALGWSTSGVAYSMSFAGAAVSLVCCLLSAEYKRNGSAM